MIDSHDHDQLRVRQRPCGSHVHGAPAVLAALDLTSSEYLALQRQGFVATERRGRGRARFKLRFRVAGRQRVRCLGSDAQRAEAVRRALVVWQTDRRREKELQLLIRNANHLLRQTKRDLEPALRARGFRFHGLSIRRRRGVRPTTCQGAGARDAGAAAQTVHQ